MSKTGNEEMAIVEDESTIEKAETVSRHIFWFLSDAKRVQQHAVKRGPLPLMYLQFIASSIANKRPVNKHQVRFLIKAYNQMTAEKEEKK